MTDGRGEGLTRTEPREPRQLASPLRSGAWALPSKQEYLDLGFSNGLSALNIGTSPITWSPGGRQFRKFVCNRGG
jgi:hypothetical protein